MFFYDKNKSLTPRKLVLKAPKHVQQEKAKNSSAVAQRHNFDLESIRGRSIKCLVYYYL